MSCNYQSTLLFFDSVLLTDLQEELVSFVSSSEIVGLVVAFSSPPFLFRIVASKENSLRMS
jgi:hypothetical protein